MEMNLLEVAGFYPAVMSVRAALKSYDKSDSTKDKIGLKDKELIEQLVKAGPEHSKCIRQIHAWFSVEAPRFWWQEFDTYRIGIEKGSESTMHTITSRPLEFGDFDDEGIPEKQLEILNDLIETYNQNKHPEIFLAIKRILPEGFLQKRFVCSSYQALRTIYGQRLNHRLPHWRVFCQWLKEKMPESWIITAGFGQ
jgi:hypothetical protein